MALGTDYALQAWTKSLKAQVLWAILISIAIGFGIQKTAERKLVLAHPFCWEYCVASKAVPAFLKLHHVEFGGFTSIQILQTELRT